MSVNPTVTIKVSKDLYEAVKHKVEISQNQFEDVEEYIEFVLREIIKEEVQDQTLSNKDEARIKNRLESLGYF